MNQILKQVKILEYIKNNPNLLSKKEIKYLLSYNGNLDEDIRRYPDYFRQIYDELNLIQDDNNIYLGFLKMLEEEFPIENRQIIEVGAGRIPTLGKRISLKQKNGTITVYDPLININEKETSKFHIKREKFDRTTPLNNTNLIIGFMPCEGADIIVERATKEKIDFMIALCEGGPHGDIYDYFESDEEWRNSLMIYASNKLEEYSNSTLKVKTLEKYHNPYPVIYSSK